MRDAECAVRVAGCVTFSGSFVVSTAGWIVVGFCVYFGLNFLCALVLHLHAEKQAHLPVRLLDIVVHFVLLTAFALPVLLVITMDAVFGGREKGESPVLQNGRVPKVPHARAA
jgi:hypothetical protein